MNFKNKFIRFSCEKLNYFHIYNLRKMDLKWMKNEQKHVWMKELLIPDRRTKNIRYEKKLNKQIWFSHVVTLREPWN